MAELKRPRVRAQLAAIAWARWRWMLHSVRTTRGALELASRIWIGFWFTLLGLGGAIGFGVAGWYFLRQGKPEWIALLLWPLFAFWQIFPLAASAFTEHMDASSLGRFPLRYPAYFLVRVTLGSLDASTLAGSLCLCGLVVGCGIAAPGWLPVILVGVGAFAAFNLLLAQMIFAWLERWLAQRRTREIALAVFFLVIFSFNFAGPLLRHWHRAPSGGWGRWQALLPLERWLPPGLPAHALGLGQGGHWVGMLGGLALLLGWTGAVLGLLHLRLQAEYRGENLSEARVAVPRSRPVRRHVPAAAAGRPGRNSPVLAIAQKELRYLRRSPMMLFTLVMPVALLVFFRLSALGSAGPATSGRLHLNFASLGFPLGVGYALLVLTNLIFNTFGTDAAGVQFYFVSPVRFRQILMGKNLAHTLILGIEVVAIYVAVAGLAGPPSAWVTVATLIGVVFAALCDFSCGNLVSLYLPKKIDPARLGRQSGRGVSSLMALAIQAVVAGLAAIAVLGGMVMGKPWLMGLMLAGLAAVAALGYQVVLAQAETIAQSRREVLITELSKS